MSTSEAVLWARIRRRKLGFKFRRQFAVDRFFLDFYCVEAQLCVEVDGPMHDPERDRVRDLILGDLGIETLRIPSASLFSLDEGSLGESLELIQRACIRRAGRKPFPSV